MAAFLNHSKLSEHTRPPQIHAQYLMTVFTYNIITLNSLSM
jgi:hypothetical protein